MTSGTNVGAGEEPTRVVERPSAGAHTNAESVLITAEIPQFTTDRGRRTELAAPTWRPSPESRQPAPALLRTAVSFLFLLTVLGAVGLAVEHFHPGWLAFLRNTTGTTKGAAAHRTSATGGSSLPVSGTFALDSSNAKGATYTVPSSSYVLVVGTANRCWTTVKAPPGAPQYVFAGTISPAQSPKAIRITGPAAVTLSAHATSLTIEVGSKRVGSIDPPKEFFTYTFVPSTH